MTGVRLPTNLSGQQVRKALQRIGFVLDRQRGSHMVLYRENPYCCLVVPDHKQVRPGTLRHIIRQAGLTVEQFNELL